jgi:dihydrofolate reductase
MSGRIVVTEFISVDGVIEDPGGAEDFEYGGWSFEYDRGDDGDKFKMEELEDAEVQLLGRVTYEAFADAWPSREGDFADKINKGRKVLVSTTLTDPTWENTRSPPGTFPTSFASSATRPTGTSWSPAAPRSSRRCSRTIWWTSCG